MKDKQLEAVLKYWAADKEGVPVTGISKIDFDVDTDIFMGSDVTPPEPIEIVIKYTVTKQVSYRVEVDQTGPFLIELARVVTRGPMPKELPDK